MHSPNFHRFHSHSCDKSSVPFQFTEETPIRILLGHDDSGVISKIASGSHSTPHTMHVNGAVEMHLAHAEERKVESVELEFSGKVKTLVDRGKDKYHDKMDIFVPSQKTLWRLGSTTHHANDQGIISLPFSFALPASVLPSIEGNHHDFTDESHIRYKLQATAVRHIHVHHSGREIKVKKHLTVVPPGLNVESHTPTTATSPQEDWVESAHSHEIKRSLRHHGAGHVEMDLCLSGVHKGSAIPLHQKVPFTATITTFSIPTYPHIDLASDKEASFPSFVPGDSEDHSVHLRLKRYTTIRVRCGTLGPVEDSVVDPEVVILSDVNKKEGIDDVEVGEKKWVAYEGPDEKEKGKGSWVQSFVLRGSFTLLEEFASPTFKSQLMDVEYGLGLDLKIPSPSSVIPHHELTVHVPIIISS